MVKTYNPVSIAQLERKMQGIQTSWLCEECRKERTHVDQTKETIFHVFGDNDTRTLGTFFFLARENGILGQSRIICGLVEVYLLNYKPKYIT